ncbi:MAG: hypothetical protein LC792_28275, partial [Actinobacteria bacterium]|nr:hypothetical protein [Actinomycetota bacterium]
MNAIRRLPNRAATALVIGALLAGTACAEPQGHHIKAVAADSPQPGNTGVTGGESRRDDIPLVIATHPQGGPVPSPAAAGCTVYDYGGLPGRPMFAYHSPEEALSEDVERSASADSSPRLPRRGWHRINQNDGGVLFIYVSHGQVGARVAIGTDQGTYGTTEDCGTDNGPPDPDWQPPPAPPPLGSTPEEHRRDDENTRYRDTPPAIPGGTFTGTEQSAPAGTLADTTLFHYALQGRKCEATLAVEQALLDAGFVGTALETADSPSGSI